MPDSRAQLWLKSGQPPKGRPADPVPTNLALPRIGLSTRMSCSVRANPCRRHQARNWLSASSGGSGPTTISKWDRVIAAEKVEEVLTRSVLGIEVLPP